MTDWMRGCSLDTAAWTFRGGPFPDDVVADVTMLYGPRDPIETSPGVWTGWVDPTTQLRVDFHLGVDTVPRGFAPSGVGCNYMARGYGVVTRVIVADPSFGNAVECSYPSGDGHTYRIMGMHLRDAPLVSIGQAVTPDTVLGVTGATGKAKGGHLHEAAWRDDYFLDPLSLYNEAQPVGYLPPEPVAASYAVPDVQWVPQGWGAEGASPWAHVYPMRARTARAGAYIGLERDGRDSDGYELFRLVVEDY